MAFKHNVLAQNKNQVYSQGYHAIYARERRARDVEFLEKRRLATRASGKRRSKIAREYIRSVKKASACICCGENDFRCLVFHHRVPEEKSFDMTRAIAHGATLAKIDAEIKKCDILCCNCHAVVHFPEQKEEA